MKIIFSNSLCFKLNILLLNIVTYLYSIQKNKRVTSYFCFFFGSYKKKKKMIKDNKTLIENIFKNNNKDTNVLIYYDNKNKTHECFRLSETHELSRIEIDYNSLFNSITNIKTFEKTKNVILLQYFKMESTNDILLHPFLEDFKIDIKIVCEMISKFELFNPIKNSTVIEEESKIFLSYGSYHKNAIKITSNAPLMIINIFDEKYTFQEIFKAIQKNHLPPQINTIDINLTFFIEQKSELLENYKQFTNYENLLLNNDPSSKRFFEKRKETLIKTISNLDLDTKLTSQYLNFIKKNVVNVILKIGESLNDFKFKPYYNSSLICIKLLTPGNTISYSLVPIFPKKNEWIENNSNAMITNKAKIFKFKGKYLIEEFILASEKRVSNLCLN